MYAFFLRRRTYLSLAVFLWRYSLICSLPLPLSLSHTHFHTVSFPLSRTIFLIFVILCLDTPSPSFHPLTIDFLPSLICFKNPPYFPFLFVPFPYFPFLFFTFPFPYFPFLFPFLPPSIYFPSLSYCLLKILKVLLLNTEGHSQLFSGGTLDR